MIQGRRSQAGWSLPLTTIMLTAVAVLVGIFGWSALLWFVAAVAMLILVAFLYDDA